MDHPAAARPKIHALTGADGEPELVALAIGLHRAGSTQPMLRLCERVPNRREFLPPERCSVGKERWKAVRDGGGSIESGCGPRSLTGMGSDNLLLYELLAPARRTRWTARLLGYFAYSRFLRCRGKM